MTRNCISYKLAESGQEIVRFGDFDAVYILLPMTEVKEGHQFISTQNLYELETNKKIHLDLHFQSPERWNDTQRRLYIKSVLRGTVPTPIVLAHVESCMNFCKNTLGEDSEDYKYFKSLYDNCYEYISVDGNNRTKCLRRFFDNEYRLDHEAHKMPEIEYDNYKNWQPKKDNNKFDTLPQYVKEHLQNNCRVCIYIIKDSNVEDLHNQFSCINSGIALNPQEWRNSIICNLSTMVRENAVDYLDFFNKYWSQKKQYRRSHEEWIVTNFVHVTRSGNIDKKERDQAYSNLSSEYENNKRVRDTIKIMERLCTNYDKNNTLKSEATLTDFFMFIDWCTQNNYKIHNERKFFDWFQLTYLTAKSAKTDTIDGNGVKKKTSIVLYEDNNGNNVRDYIGTQRSTNLVHREARLGVYTNLGMIHERYGDILPKLEQDVLIQKDSKRAFPTSYRFELWKDQDGKCALTGEDIPQMDIFNGKKYVIDHKIPHASGVDNGGTTTYENAQLVCYDENKNKSDKISFVTL